MALFLQMFFFLFPTPTSCTYLLLLGFQFQVALQFSFIHFSIFLVVLGERINLTPVTLSSAKTEVQ